MKVPIDRGAAEGDRPDGCPGLFDISPGLWQHGRLHHRGLAGGHEEKIALVATERVKFASRLSSKKESERIRFSPDGKAIAYTIRENGVDNLWQQPSMARQENSSPHSSRSISSDFHWSLDGKQLAMVRGHYDSDVVLMRDIRR